MELSNVHAVVDCEAFIIGGELYIKEFAIFSNSLRFCEEVDIDLPWLSIS